MYDNETHELSNRFILYQPAWISSANSVTYRARKLPCTVTSSWRPEAGINLMLPRGREELIIKCLLFDRFRITA